LGNVTAGKKINLRGDSEHPWQSHNLLLHSTFALNCVVCGEGKLGKGCNIDVSKSSHTSDAGSCHKSQKPQEPIRNRQTRKVANAKGLNPNTNLT